jgi:hypothetical protein
MPIQPKLIGSNTTEYKYVHSKENEFLCKRVTYQEYKMDYDITSDEYDDLDIGYEIIYSFGVLFVPEIMALDIFDIQDQRKMLRVSTPCSLLGFSKFY